MTPPRAVVEATRRALNMTFPEIENIVPEECAAVATAVLAAFFAGEVEGPATVRHEESVHYGTEWWTVTLADGTELLLDSEAEARRVAHALNWRGE